MSSFMGALGGEADFDAAENTLTIVFEAEAAGEAGADPAALDAEIESVLPTGRWSRVAENGTSFFDFHSDHTGKVGLHWDMVWRVEDGKVVVEYTTDQGEDRKWVFRFEKSEEAIKLVNVENGKEFELSKYVSGEKYTLEDVESDWEYTLEGDVDPMAGVMGTWKVADGSGKLEVSGDGTFRMDLGGAHYAGTWAVQGDVIYLTQNGIAIQGKFSKDSLVLNIGGTEFAFGR